MATYRVHVILEAEFDDIEADTEEEAFIIASDNAMMGGGDWQWKIERVEEEEE